MESSRITGFDHVNSVCGCVVLSAVCCVLEGPDKAPPINVGVDVNENVTCVVCSPIGCDKTSLLHCRHYGNIGVVTSVIGDRCCKFNDHLCGYAYPPILHSHCLEPLVII